MNRGLILLLLLINIPIVCFADLCEAISGQWQGEWENEQRQIYQARLELEVTHNTHFSGQFYLSNHSSGSLQGHCKTLKPDEAFLTLRKDAPWYNICRGLLVKTDDQLALHFWCYNPNQSGYFKVSL